MDKDIVYEEVSEAIQSDPKAYPKKKVETILQTQIQGDDTGNSKDQKEKIIMFKEAGRLFFVVVSVQSPQQTMHNIFMGEPGYGFHGKEGHQHDQNIK
ncbi:MAG: hypothetical protein ACO1NS_03230 [Daejeonella sp.]|uniref:hypothetical protein n=1 Tax=Daejeonella sp. JGW-45 TaxID=3034148 RepID=UPI0032049FE0